MVTVVDGPVPRRWGATVHQLSPEVRPAQAPEVAAHLARCGEVLIEWSPHHHRAIAVRLPPVEAALIARLVGTLRLDGAWELGDVTTRFDDGLERGDLVVAADDEAEVIRIVTTMREEGASYRSICDALTAAGLQPRRAKTWHPMVVRSIAGRN